MYQQGTISPLFLGRGGREGLGTFFPGKFWNFKSLKCDFQGSGDLRPKERVFLSRKCSFQFIGRSQFLQAMSRWWKLNYVLLHLNNFCIKKRLKNDWNIAFIWLNHYGKPVGLYENTSWFLFHSDLMIHFFNSNQLLLLCRKKVANLFRQLSVLIGTPASLCHFTPFHLVFVAVLRPFRLLDFNPNNMDSMVV